MIKLAKILEIKNISGSSIKLLSFNGERWYDDVDKVDIFLHKNFKGISEEIIDEFKKTGFFRTWAHDAEFDLKLSPDVNTVTEIDDYLQSHLLKIFKRFLSYFHKSHLTPENNEND